MEPLQGTRCALRPWRMHDLDSLVRQANDLDVARQLRDRFPHPYTRGDGIAFLRYTTSADLTTNFAIDVLGNAAGGIGYVRGTDVERYSAEIGYWLGREFWGRGITTEAVLLLTDYLFRSGHLLRLFALPFVQNRGSARVLEKAGFVREGVLACSAVKFGEPRDQALYARVNRDWRMMNSD